MEQKVLRIQRHREAYMQYGLSRSTYYCRISEGLIPRPFSLGDRAVGQLEHETQAVIAALVAGKSKDEIKALVSFLMDERTGTTGEYSA